MRESLGFLCNFWGLILRATRNCVLDRQVYLGMRRRLELEGCLGIGLETDDRILSKEPYRDLIRVLCRGYGAPAFWARRLDDLAEQPRT